MSLVAVARFLELSWVNRLRAMEAFVFLGVARMAVLTIPFRVLARRFGETQRSPKDLVADEPPAAPATIEFGRLIERVSLHTPWNSNCLATAIAAKFMLRRRGVKTTMYFGVTKDEQGNLEAHAWTSCGGTILTGKEGVGRFSVIAAFADAPKQ